MSKPVLCKYWFARSFLAFTAGILFMIPVIAILANFTTVGKVVVGNEIIIPIPNNWILWIGIIVSLILIFGKVWFEFKRLTHDPSWVLKFQDDFLSLKAERSEAASTLKKYQNKLTHLEEIGEDLSKIDDVLDFFEDLGFYMRGHIISPEVLHHHFYFWLYGYYTLSKSYIDARRQNDPTRWEYLEELFSITKDIEERRAKKLKMGIPAYDMGEFFYAEIDGNKYPNNQPAEPNPPIVNFS